MNSVFVGCSRCLLGFWVSEKYAQQNDPLNQGNLHKVKLRLKIVRYTGIEVGDYSLKVSIFSQHLLRHQHVIKQPLLFITHTDARFLHSFSCCWQDGGSPTFMEVDPPCLPSLFCSEQLMVH